MGLWLWPQYQCTHPEKQNAGPRAPRYLFGCRSAVAPQSCTAPDNHVLRGWDRVCLWVSDSIFFISYHFITLQDSSFHTNLQYINSIQQLIHFPHHSSFTYCYLFSAQDLQGLLRLQGFSFQQFQAKFEIFWQCHGHIDP